MNVSLKLNSRWVADTGLVLSTLTWGFDTILIKLTIETFPPLLYLGIRFLTAGILMALLFWPHILELGKQGLYWSLLCGAFLFGGFSLQTVGLSHTTPGISAFLSMTAFIFVPILKSALTRIWPERKLGAGIFLVTVGLWFLFYQGRLVFGLGEGLTLASAVLFAVHILVLDKAVHFAKTLALATIQVGTTGFLSLIMALFLEPVPSGVTPFAVAVIGYGALFGSIGAFMLQTWAQRLTPPSHVGLLLGLEAPFAFLFSLAFGLDILSGRAVLGLVLVFLGVIVAEVNGSIEWAEQGISRVGRDIRRLNRAKDGKEGRGI